MPETEQHLDVRKIPPHKKHSTILVLAGFTVPAKLLFIAGSLFLLAVMLYLYNMQPVAHHLIMVLGVVALRKRRQVSINTNKQA